MTPVQQEVKKTEDMSPLAIILCADFWQTGSDSSNAAPAQGYNLQNTL